MTSALFASIIERYDIRIFRGPDEYVIRIDASEDVFYEFWGPTLMDAALSASEWVEAQYDRVRHDHSEDNNGNICDVHDTSCRSTGTDFILRDWRLVDAPETGYIAEEDDQGHNWCLCWYGPGERFGTAEDILASLVSRGVAYRIA